MSIVQISAIGVLGFWLLVSHAMCDMALQNDFIAQAKNRHTALGSVYWPWVLASHGLIHGAGVAFVTGSVGLGMCEVIAHSLIDFSKCEGWIGFHVDQTLHVLCKVLWVAILVGWL